MQTETMNETDPVPLPSDWLAMGHEAAIDCETAAMLRGALMPQIRSADSWPELARSLDGKGFGLVIRDGRMVLTDTRSGRLLCTGAFLGTPLHEL
ncbi:hypothetical protein AB9K41_03810, partial [Cribrihabitans sp. XS_ASV171]